MKILTRDDTQHSDQYVRLADAKAEIDERVSADTALLRKALAALVRRHCEQSYPEPDYLRDVIAAMRERLGEKA